MIHWPLSRWVPSKMHRQHSRMHTSADICTVQCIGDTADDSTAASRNPTPTQVSYRNSAFTVSHQKGVSWIFHDQATGQLRYVNVPYMDSTGQQSPSPSIQQAATQHTPNWMTQQAHQMPSAEQLMTYMSSQPAMMTNSANMVSPQ